MSPALEAMRRVRGRAARSSPHRARSEELERRDGTDRDKSSGERRLPAPDDVRSRRRTHADVSTTRGIPGPYGITDRRGDARRRRLTPRCRNRVRRRRSRAGRAAPGRAARDPPLEPARRAAQDPERAVTCSPAMDRCVPRHQQRLIDRHLNARVPRRHRASVPRRWYINRPRAAPRRAYPHAPVAPPALDSIDSPPGHAKLLLVYSCEPRSDANTATNASTVAIGR